jgi:hypothetical protein
MKLSEYFFGYFGSRFQGVSTNKWIRNRYIN